MGKESKEHTLTYRQVLIWAPGVAKFFRCPPSGGLSGGAVRDLPVPGPWASLLGESEVSQAGSRGQERSVAPQARPLGSTRTAGGSSALGTLCAKGPQDPKAHPPGRPLASTQDHRHCLHETKFSPVSRIFLK